MGGIIIIVGCGRSGTNWLSRILDSSDDIINYGEYEPLFSNITQDVLFNKPFNNNYYDQINDLCKNRQSVCLKIHPMLWYLDDLIPKYKIIGIYRNKIDTVSSMVNHGGLKYWCDNYKKYPMPNNFLGINNENIDLFEKSDVYGKMIFRWKSHYDELMKYKKHIHIIKYEDLIDSYDDCVNGIEKYLGCNISKNKEIKLSKHSTFKNLDDKKINELNELYKKIK